MDENYAPRRRGRPPRQEPEVEQASEAPQATPTPRRRRRASVGGMHLKLSVPERKGWVRRWVNDEPGRIANAEELAYTHVVDTGIKSDSPDSRVRRLVGKTEHGAPLFAYLMETPEHEYAHGAKEKEEAIRTSEKAIVEGRNSSSGSVDNEYGRRVSIRAD